MTLLTRRDWVRLALAASLGRLNGAAHGQIKLETYPFQLGVASEFIGTGISMKSYFPKMSKGIQGANRHAIHADAGVCGFAVVDVRPQCMSVQYKVVDSLATHKPGVSKAGEFLVEAGSPQVLPA